MKLAVILSLAVLTCWLPVPPASGRERKVPKPPAGQANRLARTIVGADDAGRAIRATRRALALSGVATIGSRRARRPRSIFRVSPLVVGSLALEARATAADGLSARDVVLMHRRAGSPFRRGARGFRRLVRKLVVGARRRPRNPFSFGPLFIDAMARHRRPAVDLSRRRWPADVRFGDLEVQVLAASLERVVRLAAGGRGREARATVAQRSNTPCSDMEKELDALAPTNPVEEVLWESAKEWLGDKVSVRVALEYYEDLLEQAGYTTSNRNYVERAFEAWSLIVKYTDLINLLSYTYGNMQVIRLGPEAVHRPFEPHAAPVRFEATIGLSEDEWNDLLDELGGAEAGLEKLNDWRAMRDCLATFGVELPQNLADVGATIAEGAEIRWTVSDPTKKWVSTRFGQPPLAWQNPYSVADGRIRSGLIWPVRMVTPVTGVGTLVVDTEPEPGHAEPYECGEHDCRRVTVRVRAEVIGLVEPPIDGAPSIQAAQAWFKKLLTRSGLAMMITDLGIGMVRTMFPPSAAATVTLTGHEPCPVVDAGVPCFAGIWEGRELRTEPPEQPRIAPWSC